MHIFSSSHVKEKLRETTAPVTLHGKRGWDGEFDVHSDNPHLPSFLKLREKLRNSARSKGPRETPRGPRRGDAEGSGMVPQQPPTGVPTDPLGSRWGASRSARR